MKREWGYNQTFAVCYMNGITVLRYQVSILSESVRNLPVCRAFGFAL